MIEEQNKLLRCTDHTKKVNNSDSKLIATRLLIILTSRNCDPEVIVNTYFMQALDRDLQVEMFC